MTSSNTHIKGSTRDYVYQIIKEQIISSELKPGAKISEKEVAVKLNVSRTPVREAFLKLAQEELLAIIPQSGTIVSPIDLSIVEEGRFIREHIERAVVREACEKFDENLLFQLETNIEMQRFCMEKGTHQRLFDLDEEFHKILFDGCNKSRSWRMVRQMNCHFDRVRMLRLLSNLDWKVVFNQHRQLFEAISSKNPDRAEEIMIQHLKLVIVEKEQLKELYPDYFK
ncbi:GntR family transcriptional regulator [Halalkalibacter urbisdiaboli]|uniref:GntR family transcriptional regulator n=1 Tax=Halalkalibacter urbisdiaboli TaxID=1960589 RepID=UPI001A999A22